MSMSSPLFTAILAMDAYNRGHGARVFGLSDENGTRIGTATILTSDNDAIAFYAIAYLWNGRTVISYRGTDDRNLDPTDTASDVYTGWISGAGIMGPQSVRAEQFYDQVTRHSIFDGTLDNVLLTGHSLGGGLAGYIAAITGDPALVFDNMPYGAAAYVRTFDENPVLATLNPMAVTWPSGASNTSFIWGRTNIFTNLSIRHPKGCGPKMTSPTQQARRSRMATRLPIPGMWA